MCIFRASPQAFYVYSTVKIITAAAVTDSSGNVVCATFSGFPSVFPATSYSTSTYPYHTYWGTETHISILYSTLPSSLLTPYTTYTTVITYTDIISLLTYSPEGTFTTTVTDELTFAYANQYAEAYFGSMDTEPTGVVISLTTPFVYLPSRGANGATQDSLNGCPQSPGGSINFGCESILQLAVSGFGVLSPRWSFCVVS
jgi:hypothetical protein